MEVLIIGADNINPIKSVLTDLGAKNITHWDARNENKINRKSIPNNTDCVIMLTSFLNHNTMKTFKNQAQKRNIPIVFSKRSVNCVYEEYCKVFGLNQEFGCQNCHKG